MNEHRKANRHKKMNKLAKIKGLHLKAIMKYIVIQYSLERVLKYMQLLMTGKEYIYTWWKLKQCLI
jgi:hypothetical protein